jgi:short-subunit dehydrogenase
MKTAVVTGASSGIGEAAARRLARDGWRLLLVARRADRLEALCGEVGGGATYEAADLTDPDTALRIAARVEDDCDGSLQLLVNNAGGDREDRPPFAEAGYARVREIMELNFDSAVRLTEALLPILRRSAPSAIVNVSSIAARIARRQTGPYSASKAALAAWSDALYLEERPHGVHVATVLPGFVATEGFPQERLIGSARTRWMVGRPEQVADAIVAAANGKPEVAVPRWYGVLPRLRYATPGLVRRALRGGR